MKNTKHSLVDMQGNITQLKIFVIEFIEGQEGVNRADKNRKNKGSEFLKLNCKHKLTKKKLRKHNTE